jgi:GNAT superfamily N-acetyltransferase
MSGAGNADRRTCQCGQFQTFDILLHFVNNPLARTFLTRTGILGKEGEVETFVTIVSDMLTPGVWHIGLFILSTHKHGQGVATRIYEGHEAWLKTFGAKWLRLGVIEGNDRAERFWERSGFSEVRRRHNVPMKNIVHSLRVMVKPLTKASLTEYLKVVTRDRPDSA